MKIKEERWAPASEAGSQVPVNAGEAATCLGTDERGTGRRPAFCFEGGSVARGKRKREGGQWACLRGGGRRREGVGVTAGGSVRPATIPDRRARAAPCRATREPGGWLTGGPQLQCRAAAPADRQAWTTQCRGGGSNCFDRFKNLNGSIGFKIPPNFD
jgi:hypothetical protein